MEKEQMVALKSDLLRDEGFSDRVYKDSRGIDTFGIGFTRICKDDALYVLEQEINRKWAELVKVMPWVVNLDSVRQNILANLVYNLGTVGLLGFHKMLVACKAGDFATAAKEMLRSEWSKQVGLRAQRLSLAMETGKNGLPTDNQSR